MFKFSLSCKKHETYWMVSEQKKSRSEHEQTFMNSMKNDLIELQII